MDALLQPDWDTALAEREAEIVGDTPPTAIEIAEALCAAAGRADGIAARQTVPFNPALSNLRYRLLLYAAITRAPRLRRFLPEYRLKARAAVRCYRALQAEGRS